MEIAHKAFNEECFVYILYDRVGRVSIMSTGVWFTCRFIGDGFQSKPFLIANDSPQLSGKHVYRVYVIVTGETYVACICSVMLFLHGDNF